MDPFTTPPRKHGAEGFQVFDKMEVVALIESFSFDYIELPTEMTMSTDEAITLAFYKAFCDALATSLSKSVPARSSPKKLLEQISSSKRDKLTKYTVESSEPESPKISQALQDKLSRVPDVFAGFTSNKGATHGMMPFLNIFLFTKAPENRIKNPADLALFTRPTTLR